MTDVIEAFSEVKKYDPVRTANREAFMRKKEWIEIDGGWMRVRLGRKYMFPDASVRSLPKDDFIFSVLFPEKVWI